MAESESGGEKTEEPTRKKIEDAAKRGDIPKSQEINVWFGLAASTLALSAFGGSAASSLTPTLKIFLERPQTLALDAHALINMAGGLGLAIGAALALPMLLLSAAAIAGNLVQHPFQVTTEGLAPKFSKVSPVAGFKRLFSPESLANFLKGLLKLLVVGTVITIVVWPERARVAALTADDVQTLLPIVQSLAQHVLVASVIIFALIAMGDYLWQRHRWRQRLMMTLQEVKEEHKQQEGDPHIKARVKRIRLERSKKRMMAAVPGATVVIANPTHYAVALKYDPGMNAPLCVAKGVDAIALRIRRVAEEAGVEVVENPPLARSLHAAIEIDREIPAEHYKAVAEVISFVMKRKGRRLG